MVMRNHAAEDVKPKIAAGKGPKKVHPQDVAVVQPATAEEAESNHETDV